MADRLKEIQEKILAWWNKFTSKQKTLIVGGGAVIIFTFSILIYVFSRPQYTGLMTCKNAAEAAEVIEILEGAGITQHKESLDGLRIEVQVNQLSNANLALGAAGYVPDDYSPDDALSGGFATTESDKQKRWTVYIEKKLAKDFESLNAVKSARVTIHPPIQDGTLIAQNKETSASIYLELRDTFTAENAANMAKATATALGNTTTANITITDADAKLLFSGEEDYTSAGIANSNMELRDRAESVVRSQVKELLLGTNQFDLIEVVSRLDIDYSNYEKTVSEFYAPDGSEEGMKTHEEVYDSENQNGVGGVPGTASNDGSGNTYMHEDYNNSSSSESNRVTDYQPNQSVEHQTIPAGSVNYSNSSIAITAISYKEIKEENVKAQGLLDGIKWGEYKNANDERIKLEVDPDLYQVVSNATGISADKITILAYEEPIFYDREGLEVNSTDVLSIVMLVIILGLLAFVVLRSMQSKRVVVEEEELSVEHLLQSTPEVELEDIELENKSETRKIIEKFVDDNPEATANLLRNWLMDDWGY